MKKYLSRILPKIYGVYFNSLALLSKERAAQKAFQLFCTPRKGKVLPHQKEFLDSAKLGTVEADGVRFQTYRWEGKNDTVLLLHGWESNSFRWRNLITFLKQEEFDIIAIDAPAHGYSSSKTFNAPLYVKGARPIVKKYKPKYLIAHSIGGMTALYHQHKFPNSGIEKIVTLGSPSDFSMIAKGYKDVLGLNEKVMTAMNTLFLSLFGFQMDDFSTAKFAEHFTIRGLLIHDEMDRVTPISGSEKLHTHWKNSTLLKTKGFGHSLHHEEVSEMVIEFLKS